MSASSSGALKAWLESQGLGISFYRDRAPDNQALPYGTISEGISITSEPAFNAHDDPEGHVREVVQVDLWEQWRNPTTGAVTESYTLADATVLALDGKRATTAPTWVGGMTVVGSVRLVEVEVNTIHTAITVEIRRTLARL